MWCARRGMAIPSKTLGAELVGSVGLAICLLSALLGALLFVVVCFCQMFLACFACKR